MCALSLWSPQPFRVNGNRRRQIVSFHSLRHTFASWLALQSTPILEIKELLGQSTLAMTERYAHLILTRNVNPLKRCRRRFWMRLRKRINCSDQIFIRQNGFLKLFYQVFFLDFKLSLVNFATGITFLEDLNGT